MHLSADISSALQQIEVVKKSIEECDDPKLEMQTAECLKTILDIVQDPVFRTIVHVQDSLSELNAQLGQHPSMLPNDFDIDVAGNLVLSINGGDVIYDFDEHGLSTPLSPRSDSASPGNNKTGNVMGINGGGLGTLSSIDIEELVRPHSQNSKQPVGSDVFAADYAQIQAIELVNDGTGLGFGIIGARTSGVIVKTILPGGVADRDGRLRSGDHILQIGDVNLHDMVSEQVAAVLRQSGTHVRLVVARPIDPLSSPGVPQFNEEAGSAVVPVRVLADPMELERYLISTGYPEIFGESSTASTPQTTTEDDRFIYHSDNISKPMSTPIMDLGDLLELPETEKLQVELTKDANGLGITIAGYVCEKEELSGIFVKSVSPGSAADLSGRIRVNDRIIEVDGQSLHGFSNHQAVELLKKSGQVVNLRLERYLRGPKYEQLQQAIAANDKIVSSVPTTPSRNAITSSVSSMSSLITPQRVSSNAAAVAKVMPTSLNMTDTNRATEPVDIIQAPEAFSVAMAGASPMGSTTTTTTTTLSTFGSGKKLISVRDSIDGTPKVIPSDVTMSSFGKSDSELTEAEDMPLQAKNLRYKYYVDPELTPEVEAEIVRKWKKIVGPDVDVIVAQIKKFPVGGLGISLEGTVDVEDGREVRPHHYIRSILSDGPVGVNGILRSGDELLEVNGERLLGMNHLEVVAILKELPQYVRMVVGRGKNALMPFSDATLKKLSNNFDNLLPASDRLVKAKSDGSLATAGSVNDESFSKLKSRSLEPLTGLAMWSSEPQIIELVKGDRGLGFSILDYQDPLDPNDTLIVIRSLVPGGVAQLDGRLIPGDRLLFVNSTNLENASLDQAVQALKGAPKGVVRIGVAKPLPMTDNTLKTNAENNSNKIINSNGKDSESSGIINNSREDGAMGNDPIDIGAEDIDVSINSSIKSGKIEPDLITDWRK